ncbi:unnamed protein product [Linum trigynum]|uniref:S-acyltransferase n=1 Tax=Linum trigynum TaxID=586398 RepID=A0AAV2G993_9ROSI
MEPITSLIEEDEDDESEMEAIALSTPPMILELPDSSTQKQQHSRNNSLSTKSQSLTEFVASIKLKSRAVTRALEKKLLRRCDCTGEGRSSRGSGARIYQVWPGNNVFFFHGKLIFGPDPKGLLLTTFSIAISSWVSAIYNIDDDSLPHSLVTRLFSLLLALIVLVNLFLASAFDPGIIPRSNQPPLPFNETDSSNITRTSTENRIYRPPRSCHCDICGNCVEKFDHHCLWIGQCVALRNYRRFLAFIFSALVFFFYVFAISCWRIHGRMVARQSGFMGMVKDCPETLALLAFSFAAIWFLGSLAGFHLYLIAVNQTAYENFRQSYNSSMNPYDRGILSNVKEALFAPVSPSAVDFHAQVSQESV